MLFRSLDKLKSVAARAATSYKFPTAIDIMYLGVARTSAVIDLRASASRFWAPYLRTFVLPVWRLLCSGS